MKGCNICHATTQELDPTGRCPCCAAVLKASAQKLTYGKFMAAKANPAPVRPIEVETLPSENPNGREYTCGYCGKVFYKTGPRAAYCSDQCRAEGLKKKSRDSHRAKKGFVGPRYCEICGDLLPESSRWNQKICGKNSCAIKRQERYYLEKLARKANENG